MDFSDLPEAARNRIAAAEIEAELIATSSEAQARTLVAQANRSIDPLGIDRLLGEVPLELDVARRLVAEGHERAAGHLFGVTAGQYIKNGDLNAEQFDAKLDSIGTWVCQKFGVNSAWLGEAKQQCCALALRKRAATLEASEGESPRLPVVAPKGANGNGADRRALVDAYIAEVFEKTGKRITRTDIWKHARYRSRTEFERWERGDHRATKTAHERFTGILTEKPHLK